MQQAIPSYLSKRADLERWPLHAANTDGIDTVVVIPCLAERDSLRATLASLAKNSSEQLQHTLVICVVNNRSPQHATVEDVEDNQALLRDLRDLLEGHDNETISRDSVEGLRIAFIDASSPGNELSSKDGVGLARKIGLDWAVSLLESSLGRVRLMCCLDADTTVEPNYIDAVREAFAHETAWAGVIHFEHALPENPEHRDAIIDYETFLRCHVHGLRDAGSPYAFHTVGSTMVCTPEAYVAVSGMNRRQAAEDFYFLQQLAKTGEVQPIATTTVYPAARPSHRVPFGTGRRISQVLNDSEDRTTIYNPGSYKFVKECLSIASSDAETLNDVFPHPALHDHPLHTFLRNQNFDSAWSRIRTSSNTIEQCIRQFHTWFDAFRTLKLIHFLRDDKCPNVDGVGAARVWTPSEGLGYEEQEQFLMWLREQDREAATGPPMGLG